MSRGLQRERAVAKLLRDEGWVVGSLRHTFGGGDLLAVKWAPCIDCDFLDRVCDSCEHDGQLAEAQCVEVKSTAAGPYSHFLPAHRQELLETAQKAGATAHLYWWPPRGKLERIPSDRWPPIKESDA